MKRWYIVRRPDASATMINLHLPAEFRSPPHNHLHDNRTDVLRGRCREFIRGEWHWLNEGDHIDRFADELHDIMVEPGETCVTLYTTYQPVNPKWIMLSDTGPVTIQRYMEHLREKENGR
jgi:hypothetical protein